MIRIKLLLYKLTNYINFLKTAPKRFTLFSFPHLIFGDTRVNSYCFTKEKLLPVQGKLCSGKRLFKIGKKKGSGKSKFSPETLIYI